MTLAQSRIADTVDRFYEGVSGGMGYGALKYRESITKMDEEARTLLVRHLLVHTWGFHAFQVNPIDMNDRTPIIEREYLIH